MAYVTNTKYTVTNTGFCSGASVSESNGGESNGPLISVYKAYYLRYLDDEVMRVSVCVQTRSAANMIRIDGLYENKDFTTKQEFN